MKRLTTMALLCLSLYSIGQNIGISTDGSIPGMMLDIKPSTGNDGIRINNTADDAIINLQNNGSDVWTLGFDDSDFDNFKISQGSSLGSNDRFVIDDNDDQIRSGFNGTASLPAWSFVSDENTGVYLAGTDELAFTAGGTEYLSLGTASNILVFNDYSNDIDVRYEGNGDNDLFYLDAGNDRIGISTNAPTTLFHVDGNNAQEIALFDNSNGTGTGAIMVGQNGTRNGLAAGSGSSSVGVTTGSFHYITTAGVGQAILMQDAYGAQWNAGYYDGLLYHKIVGNGVVSTIIDGPAGDKLTMYCIEAPENFFQDFGHEKLVNGEAIVELDPTFASSIVVDTEHPLKVLVQMEGDCNGVYVYDKTNTGFKVKELSGGSSNINFTYSVYGTRKNETYTDQNGNQRISDYSGRYNPAPNYGQTIQN
jgi:hypothetical protein